MNNEKSCAEFINLGREVYCMQCKRIKQGNKDMFIEEAKEHE